MTWHFFLSTVDSTYVCPRNMSLKKKNGGMGFCFSTHQDASLWYIFLKFTVINMPYTNLFNMLCCSKKISRAVDSSFSVFFPCSMRIFLSVIRTWQRTKENISLTIVNRKSDKNGPTETFSLLLTWSWIFHRRYCLGIFKKLENTWILQRNFEEDLKRTVLGSY